jgi:hypothetical protein
MRVGVIGAGPIGIAAALEASALGAAVTVFERDEPGASLRTWGPARFFTPLRMNLTPRMAALLGDAMPDGELLLTGAEYADRVLVPLAGQEPLASSLRTRTRVKAIARRGLTRGDYAGHPLRAERPFRLLVESANGEEIVEADVVLDASGGLVVPRPFGSGGLPPLGGSTLTAKPLRTLGALAAALASGVARRILLAGDGHSAANAVLLLEEAASRTPGLEVVWAVRSANRRPCEEIARDPLPERARVAGRANDLASSPPAFLRVERKAMIERVEQREDGIRVELTGGRTLYADLLAPFTGYGPDPSLVRELAIDISPVTEGGARLHRAISCITDCLSVPAVAPADLESGEADYWFAGSRAYGRSRTFLLQTGFAQLATILGRVAEAHGIVRDQRS